MQPILEVSRLSKKYQLNHGVQDCLTLRERILGLIKFQRQSTEDFWALRDISFDVGRGESVGIIGRNGAGKSTLLKILSKITPPTSGRIVSRGRVASLLEVGTGFHPELTGRENIFFNGSLLGMKKKEIEHKFDEIVDFSGVEKFLDTPLKHYSSGMQLRLAFSVAAFLEPEILIIDEVLAVGDAEFQKKCLGKMEDVSKKGRTILFVSHNLIAVETLCQSAILLDRGIIVKKGSVTSVVRQYQSSCSIQNGAVWTAADNTQNCAFFKKISLRLSGSQPQHKLTITCVIQSNSFHKDAFLVFDIVNSMGIAIMQVLPTVEPFIKHSREDQLFNVEVDLPAVIPDQYRVSAWIGSHYTETFCWEKEILAFEIYESPTKGRTFPNSYKSGFLVASSRYVYEKKVEP